MARLFELIASHVVGGRGGEVGVAPVGAEAMQLPAPGLWRGASFGRRVAAAPVACDARLEAALRSALLRRELAVLYQPQVCLDSGRIAAVEALLRWSSPLFGRVPPDTFIPVAERIGEIGRIGAWVMQEACEQLARWRAKGVAVPRVAVNVSPIQLHDPHFPVTVAAILERTGTPAGALELELTESRMLGDDDATVDVLEALRALGVSIALDDFGTGFSSLMHLKRLCVDTLKIDRAFVRNLARDPADGVIVAGVLAIARGLGLRIVAEGVEGEEALAFLREHDCHYVQGYLTGRPEPTEEITHLLRAGGVMCRGRRMAAGYC